MLQIAYNVQMSIYAQKIDILDCVQKFKILSKADQKTELENEFKLMKDMVFKNLFNLFIKLDVYEKYDYILKLIIHKPVEINILYEYSCDRYNYNLSTKFDWNMYRNKKISSSDKYFVLDRLYKMIESESNLKKLVKNGINTDLDILLNKMVEEDKLEKK